MAKQSTTSKKPNILLIGIDSLKATHMSCYGYPKQTTPHMDKFAEGGAIFEQTYSAHIPTTPGYGSMFTGMDVFSTQMVGLRHKGTFPESVQTLPEILKDEGYTTTCVGFRGNPASRGFENYIDFSGWGGTKAENLNAVTIPEIERLAQEDKPFFMLLRHMDPHSPYMPPAPFERMFYHGNECDPANKSMDPVMKFKPFCDYFITWLPGVTDKDYVISRYDGAVAYMDSCIQKIFTQLETLGILENTIVVINSDHGETLYDHDCYFDHHGIYDNTLHIPLIIRYPKRVPAGIRVKGYNQQKDLVPTLLDLAGIKSKIKFDGESVMQLVSGRKKSFEPEIYITECTWMRKHGWRTPEWKLMVALEPDFHFKPEIELYNLIEDPEENNNLAKKRPEVVAALKARMEAHIAKREKETGMANPILHQEGWHGVPGIPYFTSSQQAYDSLHIGDAKAGAKLQAAQAAAQAKK